MNFASFISGEFEGYAVVVEEENDTVYAYMICDEEIVGDVWLCNRLITPVMDEWKTSTCMPFRNTASYCKEAMIDIDISEIYTRWYIENDIVTADILHRDMVVGILKEGANPGYCINAKKSGPLALVMPSVQ